MPYSDATFATACRHVVEGQARVARQQGLIAEMESRGWDTVGATRILQTMVTSLAHMVDHRDRIERVRAGNVWRLAGGLLRLELHADPPALGVLELPAWRVGPAQESDGKGPMKLSQDGRARAFRVAAVCTENMIRVDRRENRLA